jgi:single-strand DNA-binding protein
MAATETWKDKNGQKQERTEWFRIAVWGKLAELCGEHLKKGRQAYVEGKLQTREFVDKEQRKQFITEVVAHSVIFLGGGGRGDGRSEPNEMRGQEVGAPSDDQIPF